MLCRLNLLGGRGGRASDERDCPAGARARTAIKTRHLGKLLNNYKEIKMDFSATPEEKAKFSGSGTIQVGRVNVVGTIEKETGKPVKANVGVSLIPKSK